MLERTILVRLRVWGLRRREANEPLLAIYVYVDLDRRVFQLAML